VVAPKPGRAGRAGASSGAHSLGRDPNTDANSDVGTAHRGEFEVIAALQARFEAAAGRTAPSGEIWIGDDAALVADSGGRPLLLATDLVVAGVHVDLDLCTVVDLGFKAVMVTVSDLAAMGGRPDHLLVSVAAPPGTDLDGLGSGVAEAATATGCIVVGGDLSTAPVVMVSVAAVGSIPPSTEGGENVISAGQGVISPGQGPISPGQGVLTRSGARAGDSLFVTGPLGSSSAGLRILRAGVSETESEAASGTEWAAASGTESEAASEAESEAVSGTEWAAASEAESANLSLVQAHRRPVARLAEGETARRAGATAAIDISDGLAADVRHLADASGVGIELDHVPAAKGATEDEALGGGEDYELIIATADPDGLVAAFASAGLRVPIAIGRCTADPGERTLAGSDLPHLGWRHLFG
jgi:thiamine-monophosphate kinase